MSLGFKATAPSRVYIRRHAGRQEQAIQENTLIVQVVEVMGTVAAQRASSGEAGVWNLALYSGRAVSWTNHKIGCPQRARQRGSVIACHRHVECEETEDGGRPSVNSQSE